MGQFTPPSSTKQKPNKQPTKTEIMKAIQHKNWPEAEALLMRIAENNNKDPHIWLEIALVRLEQNNQAGALEANEKALEIQPNNIDALLNTANILIDMQLPDEALSLLEAASNIEETYTILVKIGALYFDYNQFQKAAVYFSRALKHRDNDEACLRFLARSFENLGDHIAAFRTMSKLTTIKPHDFQIKKDMAKILKPLQFSTFAENTKNLVTDYLKTDGLDHSQLNNTWISLYTTNPAFSNIRNNPSSINDILPALNDDFLLQGLRRLSLPNIEFEKQITHIRKLILQEWHATQKLSDSTIPFLASLAIQAWYNEHSFLIEPEEKTWLELLLSKIKQHGHLHELLLYACYESIGDIEDINTQALSNRKNNAFIKEFYQLEYIDRQTEQDLISTLPDFAAITNETSIKVRTQYENRPYPRWREFDVEINKSSNFDFTKDIKVLNAGCGTGSEALKSRVLFPQAKVTAIDLSKSSLAYAKRITTQILGSPCIEFIHGDLLNLSMLNEKYDVIFSSGVLHHMQDPEEGLKSLLSVLSTNGRMNLAFYARHARNYLLEEAWQYVQKNSLTQSKDDVRKFRAAVINAPNDNPMQRIKTLRDFFKTSECVDLAFHVQETSYTLPELQSMLAHNKLEIMKMAIPSAMKLAYRKQHPEDIHFMDLDKIYSFEQKNPLIFTGMYRFWVKRTEDNEHNQVDTIILRDQS